MSDEDPDQRLDGDPAGGAGGPPVPPGTPAAKQGAGFSWRLKGWLAAAGTVVATATGMISLRNEIWPANDDNAIASVSRYEQSVGDVCSSLNDAERARARNARRLAKRLRSAGARTSRGQRNALLDSIKQVLARSEHDLARFAGLDPPRMRARRHERTEAVWEDSVMRLRRYAQRLDVAGSRADVLAAVDVLAAMRVALARNGVARAAGLTKLAGGDCRLDEPIVTPTLELPRGSASVDPPAPTEPARSANPPENRRSRGRVARTEETEPTPSVDPPAADPTPSVDPPQLVPREPTPSVDPPPPPPDEP